MSLRLFLHVLRNLILPNTGAWDFGDLLVLTEAFLPHFASPRWCMRDRSVPKLLSWRSITLLKSSPSEKRSSKSLTKLGMRLEFIAAARGCLRCAEWLQKECYNADYKATAQPVFELSLLEAVRTGQYRGFLWIYCSGMDTETKILFTLKDKVKTANAKRGSAATIPFWRLLRTRVMSSRRSIYSIYSICGGDTPGHRQVREFLLTKFENLRFVWATLEEALCRNRVDPHMVSWICRGEPEESQVGRYLLARSIRSEKCLEHASMFLLAAVRQCPTLASKFAKIWNFFHEKYHSAGCLVCERGSLLFLACSSQKTFPENATVDTIRVMREVWEDNDDDPDSCDGSCCFFERTLKKCAEMNEYQAFKYIWRSWGDPDLDMRDRLLPLCKDRVAPSGKLSKSYARFRRFMLRECPDDKLPSDQLKIEECWKRKEGGKAPPRKRRRKCPD